MCFSTSHSSIQYQIQPPHRSKTFTKIVTVLLSHLTMEDLGNKTIFDEKNYSELFQWPEYCVFAAVLIVSLGIGVFFGFFDKKNKTNEEFLMASRSMSIFPVTLSLICSFVSAITIMGKSWWANTLSGVLFLWTFDLTFHVSKYFRHNGRGFLLWFCIHFLRNVIYSDDPGGCLSLFASVFWATVNVSLRGISFQTPDT